MIRKMLDFLILRKFDKVTTDSFFSIWAIFKGLDEEQTLEALMEGEADCQEIETHEDGSIELTGAPTDLYKMKDAIEAACPDAEFDVEEIATTPQEYVSLEGEDMELFERLMDLLNACDDVDKIYHNVENYEGE